MEKNIFLFVISILLTILGCKEFSTEPEPTPAASWSIITLAPGEDTVHTSKKRAWSSDIYSSDVVLLSIEARIGWHSLAGGAWIMEILINDKPVTGELLVNKPITFTYADGRIFNYYSGGAELELPPYWILFYSHDYESNNTLESKYQVLEGQSCLYIFDITSLVEYGQENTVELINRGERVSDILDQPIPLVFRQVKLIKKTKV
ncbi:MAG: hypothetical protein IPM32_14420 [Ignavibacteriae bacterium]|nr:hypothetical protein [Ignavibacteriota bacterium]